MTTSVWVRHVSILTFISFKGSVHLLNYNLKSWYEIGNGTKHTETFFRLTLKRSLAKGQYMVSWLLTGAPEQGYWQNRETANVGLVSSVGRAPARQSGGRRFKSRSSKFSLVHPNLSKNVFSQSVFLVVYYMYLQKKITTQNLRSIFHIRIHTNKYECVFNIFTLMAQHNIPLSHCSHLCQIPCVPNDNDNYKSH